MKTKLYKLLGMLLTVTVLVSLMLGATAAPVAADDLEWSEADFPEEGSDGDWLYDPDIEYLGPFVQAIDGTYYIGAWVDADDDDNMDDGEMKLFKSTDAREWDETEYEGDLIMAIACSSLDADIVYVADINSDVWQSEEAGDDFDELPSLLADYPDAGLTTGIDVGYTDDDDPIVFVSTALDSDSDVFFLTTDYGAGWQFSGLETQHASSFDDIDSTWDDVYVWAIKVSPDFADDGMIIAVADAWVDVDELDPDYDAGDHGVDGYRTFATTRYENAPWGGELDGDAELLYDNDIANPIYNIYRAIIWLPDDFDSDPDGAEMGYFVGLASTDDDEGDVYEIAGRSAWDLDINGTESAINVSGLDGVGNVGDAMLVAGGDDPDDTVDTPVIFRSDNNGESWDDQKETPLGELMFMGQTQVSILVADDYEDSEECMVATVGANCGVSLSRDGGDTFDQISLMQLEWTTLAQYDAPPVGTFHNVNAGPGTPSSILRDTGDGFERTWMANTLPGPCILPAAGFSAWFLFDTDTMSLWRSTDNASYFKEQRGAPEDADEVTNFSPITETELIVGVVDGIEKTENNGSKWTRYDEGLAGAGTIKSMTKSPDFDTDETLLTYTSTGKIYISDDYGESWEEIEDFGGDATSVKFDPGYPDNGVIYAAGNDGAGDNIIERYGLDGDAWEEITPDEEDMGDMLGDDTWDSGGAKGIAISGDGTLYTCDGNLSGVFRTLNPLEEDTDDIEWEPVTKGCDDDYLAVLFALPGGPGAVQLLATGEVPTGDKAWFYKDTLVGSPTLSSPSDGSDTGRIDTAAVAWNDMDGAKEYAVKYDSDPGFKSNPKEVSGELASKVLTGLNAGKTYYWKVRAIEPILSRWSDVWSFTTALGAPQWNPFVGGVPEAPANGATNVPLQPTFAWNAADWATGYEFMLAKDSAFTDTVVSKTGANALTTTIYLCEQKLANSTTYYWKVRAISKTSSSEWASAVFTTEGVAPAPPAKPTPPPTPEPPGTPAYIWVIIGVGAALVIAVIVLIVRTRRVA